MDSFEEDTPAQRLRRAWINESFSPEILPCDEELIDGILQRIKDQEAYVAENYSETLDDQLISTLYEMETERIKYTLRAYLRARLAKIHKFYLFLSKNEQEQAKLSSLEQGFLDHYTKLVTDSFTKPFLSGLPEKFSQADEPEMVLAPDLDAYVVCRFRERLANPIVISTEDEELQAVHPNENEVVALRYGAIRNLLREGSVVELR
eukprot:TRINITY_DN33555_c0_g1_i1.p1 TRINITY_DN33555_c0_g1~~TRINITY_DN33555_c0_g1_i1.p1  ORF type:complete len:206 (+),score=30.78 TRINITY_DN33555_c0_g1_i1:131-748(+)